MNGRIFAGVAAIALSAACVTTLVSADTAIPTEGPGLKPGWPGWYLAGSASDPDGPLTVPPFWGTGNAPRAGRGAAGRGAAAGGAAAAAGGDNASGGAGGGRAAGGRAAAAASNEPPGGNGPAPRCSHSIVCEMDGTRAGGVSAGEDFARVEWRHTSQSYTVAYPFDLPAGGGDVTGAGVDAKDNVWVWQRNKATDPALFKFGPDHKLLFAVPADVTDHTAPFRGHGMGVDADGNAWVINEAGATVKEISPDGKLLMTIGQKGHRGDWDEAKGQRLLWEPVTIGFGPQGDVYIFEGHQDQSPNDVGSDDPTNNVGASRVIHLTKDGKFVNQWYGDQHGPGKFASAHGSAVDPVTGDVWVGDRQEYRIVVFNANGQYIRTIQMRNLICALYFDNHPGPRFGQVWLADGMDGQVLRIDRSGNVLFAAAGNRRGKETGQFSEATNMSSDSKGDLIVADTQIPRVTELIPPTKKSGK